MKRFAIVFVACTAVACSGGTAPTDDGRAAATGAAAQDAPRSKSVARGLSPACDRYIHMVSGCVATKMPESERAAAQVGLEQLRAMLANPMLRDRLGSCEDRIRQEIQTDRYGCYTEHAREAGIKTACDLATREELQAILKARLEPGERSGATCVYVSAGQPLRSVEIEVDWTDGRESMEAWRAGVGIVASVTRRDTAQSAVSSNELADLGDEAIFTMAGFQPFLNVRKGDVAFRVSAFGASEDDLIAIGRTIAERVR